MNDILWVIWYLVACFFLGLIPITVIYLFACLYDWLTERWSKAKPRHRRKKK